MPILRRGNKYRRYGSPQRLEFRRFGTPVKENDRDRDPDDVFLSRRMLMLRGVAAGSFALIAGRLGYLQLGPKPETGAAASSGQAVRKQTLKAPRGLITDRNGETLAENRKSWALALVRSKLPTREDARGNIVRDSERLDGMFEAVERFIPFDWAMTIKPLGPNATPAALAALASRIERYSDFNARNLAVLLGRENEDPILLAKNYTKDEIRTQYDGGLPMREVFADLVEKKQVEFLRHAEWLVSRYSQLDPDRPTVVKRSIPKEVALALDANPLDFPGMMIDETVLTRHYPAGDLTAHLLGYVSTVDERDVARKIPNTDEPIYMNDDIIGKMGVEAALEEDLRGRRGARFYRVDSFEVDRGTVQGIPVVPGAKLELTVDLGLQRAARDSLLKWMAFAQEEARKTDAAHAIASAVAVALDPRNGEVLAMVSLPSYDPAVFVDGRDAGAINALLRDNVRKPTLNKAIQEVYPAGSVLKPFLAAAGLQEKIVRPNTTHICTGEIGIPFSYDERVKEIRPCWTKAKGKPPHGPQNVVEALQYSCDVFFYNLGPPYQVDPSTGKHTYYTYYANNRGETRVDFRGLGIQLMDKHLKDFGFGVPTGLTDLPGDENGLVPGPESKRAATRTAKNPQGEQWSLGDTINVTIGQGDFLCTPLQMAVATAAVANGGAVHRPKLVRRVLAADGTVLRTADATPLRRVQTQPEYLDLVRLGMRRAVTDGTAEGRFRNVPVEVAGKTGTAEYGQYIEASVRGQPLIYKNTHAWFTAFAPYKEPEIAICVFIYGGGEGSAFAAPVASDMLEYYFRNKKP